MTRGEVLRSAALQLRACGVEAPERDARALWLWAEGIDPAGLILREREPCPPAALTRFETAIARRVGREPVSKIIGERDFYGATFKVNAHVLDPRPDTETLIDAVQSAGGTPDNILDLGTGSGAILLTLLGLFPKSRGVGVDISRLALDVAEVNAQRFGIADRVQFRNGDWAEGLDETFTLVVSNPPYVATAEAAELSPEVADWDPPDALFAGSDGLQAYRRIIADLPRLLRPEGVVALEIGHAQADPVTAMLREAGLDDVTVWPDLSGHDRCVTARKT